MSAKRRWGGLSFIVALAVLSGCESKESISHEKDNSDKALKEFMTRDRTRVRSIEEIRAAQRTGEDRSNAKGK